MQLAIQMAFYSQYKEFAPTYESCKYYGIIIKHLKY